MTDALALRLEGTHDPLPKPPPPLRYAAVIGLLLPGARLLLIERSHGLRQHAGQLAFPGGKPERQDRDLVDTVLRETEEEVGLQRDSITVLGRLEPVPTPSGFLIVPYVGRVAEGAPSPRINDPGEVERILTPTLDELRDPAIYKEMGTRAWRGTTYVLHEYAIANPPLWGATARMVYDLLERLGSQPHVPRADSLGSDHE